MQHHQRQDDPPVFMDIPARMTLPSQVEMLLRESFSLADRTKKAEVQRAKSHGLKIGGKMLYEASKTLFFSSNGRFPVRDQSGMEPGLLLSLAHMYADPPSSPPLLLLPPYSDIVPFFCEPDNLSTYTLGNFNGVPVVIGVSGGVRLQDFVDEGFDGAVNVTLAGQETALKGYITGSLRMTGTALILLEDERKLLYTPDDGAFPPWQGMMGHNGGFLSTRGGQLEVEPQEVDVSVIE